MGIEKEIKKEMDGRMKEREKRRDNIIGLGKLSVKVRSDLSLRVTGDFSATVTIASIDAFSFGGAFSPICVRVLKEEFVSCVYEYIIYIYIYYTFILSIYMEIGREKETNSLKL